MLVRYPAGRALYGWITSRDKMHADEVDITDDLVKRLLEAQFPKWAGLSIERVRSAGTDHAMYRLGEEKAVRIPRVSWAVEQAEKEHRAGRHGVGLATGVDTRRSAVREPVDRPRTTQRGDRLRGLGRRRPGL